MGNRKSGNRKDGGAFVVPNRSVYKRKVRNICKWLEKTYGNPRLGNPTDSLSDLIYILISNKTPPTRAIATYERLIKTFFSWEEMLIASPSEVVAVLKPAGLGHKKAKQILSILYKIRKDFGECSLAYLKMMDEDGVYNYLISLPGVSEKVAKCVMLYTLDIQVLPVDVHVHRISSRLGFTSIKRPEQSHKELESLIPREYYYSFHVGCIAHGRSLCRKENPECEQCGLTKFCSYVSSGKKL